MGLPLRVPRTRRNGGPRAVHAALSRMPLAGPARQGARTPPRWPHPDAAGGLSNPGRRARPGQRTSRAGDGAVLATLVPKQSQAKVR
jgi:hypothetical protein